MKVILTVVGIIFTLIFLVWLGLRIKPQPFPSFAKSQQKLKTMGLGCGLPASVERFCRVTEGENIPIIKTAVISGRGTIKHFGINVPIRFHS